MKVLFVQKVKAIAGSEKYFFEIIPALIKQNLIVEFACVYKLTDKELTIPFIQELKRLNIKVHSIEITSDKSILKIIRSLNKVIRNGNFDLLHSHLIHADFWCTLLKRLGMFKNPIVSTKHGYDEMFIANHGFEGSKVKKNFYYWLCWFSEKKIKNSFAVSNGLKKLFVDAQICKPDQIRTIHHGFNLPKVKNKINKQSEYRYSNNQIVLLGRIIPFKGHVYALEALKVAKNKIGNIKLLIIGDGDVVLKEKLVRYVKENKLDENVEFLGFRTNIYDYLVNSDLMLVPSISEGFGLVFLEAMNAELPIVGFDVSATNEIIVDQISGVLIDPYNSNEMGIKLVELLNNKTEREKLSLEAKKRLLNYFSLERMIDETILFYKDSLK